jgi:primosomal protein N'
MIRRLLAWVAALALSACAGREPASVCTSCGYRSTMNGPCPECHTTLVPMEGGAWR